MTVLFHRFISVFCQFYLLKYKKTRFFNLRQNINSLFDINRRIRENKTKNGFQVLPNGYYFSIIEDLRNMRNSNSYGVAFGNFTRNESSVSFPVIECSSMFGVFSSIGSSAFVG